MSAVLEFPPLIADEVVDAADAPPAISKEVALATIRSTALSELSAVELGIAALMEKHGATDYDITTPKGYKLATERRHAIRQVRYKVPHVVKARKAELKEIGEAVGSEGERIIAALMAIESPHDTNIAAEDTRREQEAERLRVAEAERVTAHRTRLAVIRECAAKAQGIVSERIARGIASVEALVIDQAAWEEFFEEAVTAKAETLTTMRALFASTKAAEDATAVAEALRVEQARIAEEQAATQRRLDEARELIAKAERDAAVQIEAERKKLAEEKAAWLAEQEAAKAPLAAIAAPPTASEPVVEVQAQETHPVELTEVSPRGEVMAPEACESATGRGDNVAPALAAAPNAQAPTESAQVGGKDVLGDHAEERSPLAKDDTLMVLRDALAFTLYVRQAFAGKFPSHPKPSAEWWQGLREQSDLLQPLLTARVEELSA